MKTYILPACLALVVFGSVTVVRSQSTPAQTTLRARLLEIRDANQKLLDQQTATLQKLDQVQKEAEQVKIFARRT